MKSNDAVNEIKRRVNIVDIIGRVVNLKKYGANYKGSCPFHNEKTPSFVVSEDKQIFTCFGCGASGDVFTFMEKYYSLDFRETLDKLADECGITIERYASGRSAELEEMMSINREAAKFFYLTFRMEGDPGREYMKNRGVADEVLKKFGIGSADGSEDSLYRYLKGLGIGVDKMLRLGLVSRNGSRVRDKFRNRVMFPIFNTRGKIIGFGGRDITGSSPAKYINSNESEVFRKRNNLYGLNLAKQDISRENRAILVEGYMDVIGLHQCGIKNVSASLGTALTEDQARLLKRYTGNVILCYDSDDAGRAAALRGIEVLRPSGMKVNVMHVTDGKDPDEYVKLKGKQGFLDLAEKALPSAEYKFMSIADKYDTDTAEGRIDFMKEAVKFLRTMSPIEADIYIKRLSEEYDISEAAVRKETEAQKHAAAPERKRNAQPRAYDPSMSNAERRIIELIFSDSSFLGRKNEFERYLSSAQGKEILEAMSEIYREGEELRPEEVAERVGEGTAEVVLRTAKGELPVGDGTRVYEDCIYSMKLDALKKRERSILDRIEMAEGVGAQAVDVLFNELAEVRNDIVKVKENRRN